MYEDKIWLDPLEVLTKEVIQFVLCVIPIFSYSLRPPKRQNKIPAAACSCKLETRKTIEYFEFWPDIITQLHVSDILMLNGYVVCILCFIVAQGFAGLDPIDLRSEEETKLVSLLKRILGD